MWIFILILAFLGYIAWLIYKYETGKPSYKCSHEWTQLQLWRTDKMVTYRFTCKKCGTYHDKSVAHYTESVYY